MKCPQPKRKKISQPHLNGFRQLHIDDEIWLYKIFHNIVEIRSPLHKKFNKSFDEILEIDDDYFNYDLYDEDRCSNIQPSDVKDWIVKHKKGLI